MKLLRLVADRLAPAAARRHVQQHCDESGVSPSTADTAVLLTSELVSNSVLYADGPHVELGTDTEADGVRVEVADTSPTHPAHQSADDARENGRGVQLVDELADAWGVEDTGPGKTVWFTVKDEPEGAS